MNKEQFMRWYTSLNVVIGLYFILAALFYQLNFTTEYNVTVETSIFHVTLNYVELTAQGPINTYIPILNVPLIAYLVILVLHILTLVFVARGLETTKQPLKEVGIFNVIFTVVLIAGQLLFVAMIPEAINGVARDLVFFTEFPMTASNLVRAFNIGYLVAFIYVVYNLIVLVQTRDTNNRLKSEHDDIEKEEEILRELLK
jgi:hypothetical protein